MCRLFDSSVDYMSEQDKTEIDFERHRADLKAHKPAEFVRLDDWEQPRQAI